MKNVGILLCLIFAAMLGAFWLLGSKLSSPANQTVHLPADAPVLSIQGDKDKRTFLYEALMLFDNAPEPKYLNVMEGAAHVDLHRFNTEQYETTVLSFLAEHLDHNP